MINQEKLELLYKYLNKEDPKMLLNDFQVLMIVHDLINNHLHGGKFRDALFETFENIIDNFMKEGEET